MRTTLDIDDDLMRQAKEAAARSGRPLRAVVEDALRESLSRGEQAPGAEPVRLPECVERPGLCPGVDLDDSAGLLDIMDGRS